MKSKRQAYRLKQQQKKRNATITWAVLGALLLFGLGYIIWNTTRPPVGEPVTVMADSSHVPDGTDPGPYNSDPPTSGRHYADPYPVGFYDVGAPETQVEHPEGHLVHNLEHGYIIFWYNCSQLDTQACDELKSQIKSVMEAVDNFKVIAFPKEDMPESVVMTSWGRMLRFDSFNTRNAEDFVRRNRNKAPEPEAS
jgi:hypothetical protein